jgi:hypothetical protein
MAAYTATTLSAVASAAIFARKIFMRSRRNARAF